MMKTRQDNDMTDCTGVVQTKNDVELSWPIEPCADSNDNQKGQ